MLPPDKNKGGLIVVYLAASILAVYWFTGYLEGLDGSTIDEYAQMAIAFVMTAIWTYLTKDDYYKDEIGNKIFVDSDHRLLFINMKYWPYLLLAGAIVLFLKSSVLK